MSFRVFLAGAIVSALSLQANADLNILAIGDSHTAGKNDPTKSIFRSSYRPYLEQSIRNFQSLGINDADTVTVNWLGQIVDTAAPVPNATSAIPVGNSWTDRHLAESGISSLGYEQNRAAAAASLLSGTAPGDQNLVLMLLGTNDFGMFASTDASGWSSSRYNPTDVLDSIMQIVSGFPADTETLIAAIPPLDSRRRYGPSPGNLWFESERTCSANTSSSQHISNGGTCTGVGGHQDLVHWNGDRFVVGPGNDGRDASSNDIIDAVNFALETWAASDPNVGFVDPFRQDGGYSLRGTTDPVAVNGGAAFDLTPNSNGQLDLLSDGVHLSPLGEQYYAAAFWEGGVRLALTSTAAAQAVPEPSSFIFLAMLSMVAVSARKFFARPHLREMV